MNIYLIRSPRVNRVSDLYRGVFLFISCFLFSCASIFAHEKIIEFVSDIALHTDGTIAIIENITVQAEGFDIQHGIVREFPTKYQDAWGNNYSVRFDVQSVKKNGKTEPYCIKDAINGKRIFIGSADKRLAPGIYTYTISYSTNRQIGFFVDHDELYWNVNGNGWRLPIDRIIAKVNLPKIDEFHPEPVEGKAEGYTGFFGHHGKDYVIKKYNNIIEFQTTRPFAPQEGLTIVVSFDKGLIQPPSKLDDILHFVKDNWASMWVWLGVLILLLLQSIFYRKIQQTQNLGTVIPLFYPPKNMSPGQVRYIDRMNYDTQLLSSELVHLAVQGYLTIEYDKKKGYSLHKTEKSPSDPQFNQLLQYLFASNKTIQVNYLAGVYINNAQEYYKKYIRTTFLDLFDNHSEYIFRIIMLSLIFIIPALTYATEMTWLGIVILIIMVIVFMWLARGYSQKGIAIKKEIEGFRLYLTTAETERMEIIGTPPTKTPELYEHYLPYAMALGCEKQWTAQFTPVFAALAVQGISYQPLWFHGHRHHFNPEVFGHDFSRNVSYSFSQPVSSATYRPGSSSGSSGRGSSGGGGGGGGGGGW